MARLISRRIFARIIPHLFSPAEIIGTLREMDFLLVEGEGYIPAYTRTDLTNNLHGSAGFRTDKQIISRQNMRKIISQTKQRNNRDNGDQ